MINKKIILFCICFSFVFYDCSTQNISDLAQSIVGKIENLKNFFLQKKAEFKELPTDKDISELKTKIDGKSSDLAELKIKEVSQPKTIEEYKGKLKKIDEEIQHKEQDIEQLNKEISELEKNLGVIERYKTDECMNS